MKVDYTLYLVSDRTIMSVPSIRTAVEQAILGGCTIVQLREKDITSLAFYEIAKEIKRLTDSYHIPLIINDRIDVALAVNASGVHIGQTDIPALAARKIIGHDTILGASATCVREALQAENDGADYIGVGAMFPTGTKSDASLVSMEELNNIRNAVKLPIVVIGGIGKDNAALFKDTGIDGLAVVSAIISQPKIREAAEEIKRIFVKTGCNSRVSSRDF